MVNGEHTHTPGAGRKSEPLAPETVRYSLCTHPRIGDRGASKVWSTDRLETTWYLTRRKNAHLKKIQIEFKRGGVVALGC